MTLFEDARSSVNAALTGVDVAATSTTKFNRLEEALADLTHVARRSVVATTIRKAGNVRVRTLQSERARAAHLFILVVPEQSEVAGTQRAATRLVQEGAFPALLIVDRDADGGWRPVWAVLGDDPAWNELADTLAGSGADVTRERAAVRRDEARRDVTPEVGSRVPPAPLVLDERVRRMLRLAVEANRGDLDRIFGGLLTWLSGQTVTVGKVSSHPDAGLVRLGWNDEPTSQVAGLEQLTADVPNGDSVEFLAGTEWRMLGTYNALDAQRVFRFGLALGRRFAHVPVPAPGIDGFRQALESRLKGLADPLLTELREAMVRLYVAHLDVGGATLGPAMFLAMPSYVIAGLDGNAGADVTELLAESYLTNLGTWLSRQDEAQLDQLQDTVGLHGPLGAPQWAWVRAQLHAL